MSNQQNGHIFSLLGILVKVQKTKGHSKPDFFCSTNLEHVRIPASQSEPKLLARAGQKESHPQS